MLPVRIRYQLSLIKWHINQFFFKRYVKQLRLNILSYYHNQPVNTVNPEIQSVVNYLAANPVNVFLYPFINKYQDTSVVVHFDALKNLHFVYHDTKKLYFKRSLSKEAIAKFYTGSLAEQDPMSPHRYLTESFQVEQDYIVADIGVAEGNFSLSIVEKARWLYIFEADEEWVEALQATFEPWKNKVEIICRFVANKDDAKHLSLDHFFESIPLPQFIKIDVDGAESLLLRGFEKSLSSEAAIKIAICTYHKQLDAEIFANHLSSQGFVTELSDGYMLFYFDREIQPPYFRKGLLRATRI